MANELDREMIARSASLTKEWMTERTQMKQSAEIINAKFEGKISEYNRTGELLGQLGLSDLHHRINAERTREQVDVELFQKERQQGYGNGIGR